MYYSSDSPSSLITESLSFTQSLSSLSSPSFSHRCGLEQRTNFFFHLSIRQKPVRIRSECGLDSRNTVHDTHFSWILSGRQAHNAAGRITSMKSPFDCIGNQTVTFQIVAQCMYITRKVLVYKTTLIRRNYL